MANLQKFNEKSIEELLNFNSGITILLKQFVQTENYLPDYFIRDDWKAIYEVLRVQNDVQEILKERLKSMLSNKQFEDGKLV